MTRMTANGATDTRERKTLVVQDWLKEAITWAVGDACSEACLMNLARLVAPNGYLVVSGADLDLPSRLLRELGFVPVTARCEETYAAEDVHAAGLLRSWGLEAIDRTPQEWPARYATVFRSPAKAGGGAQ